METLIEIVNKLQDIYTTSGCEPIDLPQIVVVGTQSSGKSSVLEHIVGKSFLPRGTGIVTRCPLVLQIVNSPDKEYAIFNHSPNRRFTDNKEIREEIQAQTNKLAGESKGICNKSISLKMFSPSFTSLTLIDLPGIVKNPVGDQPPNIEEQVKNLILSYINKPSCLILAVSPANTDLATSDSIKIAAQVDPTGERTLAVLTKLDIMDKGTDAWDMLLGKIIPVKLGIIGVVNRSQADNQVDKSIAESRKDEEDFFRTNYSNIAHLQGSGYLTKQVQGILMKHIKHSLPYLKSHILKQLIQNKVELELIEEKNTDKDSLLLDLLSNFSRAYVSAIKGNITNIETNDLYGGARINNVFKQFSNTVNGIEALAGLKESHLLTAIQNASGVTPPIFVPEVAFELLVKNQIEIFRQPSLFCVQVVSEEMKTIAQNCIKDDLAIKHYSMLKEAIDTAMTLILQNLVPKAKRMVDEFIDVQLAYINIDHTEFFPKQEKSLFLTGEKQPLGRLHINLPASGSGISQDKRNFDLELIKTLIKSYFAIEKKMVQDTIPKIIMCCMVNHVMEKLDRELRRSVDGKADDLLIESRAMIEKREALRREVAGLEKVQQSLHTLMSSDL